MGNGEKVDVRGDLNGHVGELAEGYADVHSGFRNEKRNDEVKGINSVRQWK